MEKKTIGKFISALRRANGMTQKELGEKLFVSDKTVSRWERDECTPELSLIPSIAEIFGITTDELLRGEKNNPERDDLAEKSDTQRSKSDKQFRLMLDKNRRKFNNLTLISAGITIFGFLSAVIADLGLSKGLIAFCLAAAFVVASEICQICFTVNARIMTDDDDQTYNDQIQLANTKVVKNTVVITFINVGFLAFCMPLITMIDGANFGLYFDSWLQYGSVFTVASLCIAYVVYMLFIKKQLCTHGLIVLNEDQKLRTQINKKLLKKVVTISVSIAAVLLIGIIVLNNVGVRGLAKKLVFDSCEDFKEFMESDYDRWYKEGYTYTDEFGNVINEIPVYGEDYQEFPNQVFETIKNFKGEVLCEYYCNPEIYYEIIFTESADNKMPVTVITNQAIYDAVNLFDNVETALYILLVIDFIASTLIYVYKKDK